MKSYASLIWGTAITVGGIIIGNVLFSDKIAYASVISALSGLVVSLVLLHRENNKKYEKISQKAAILQVQLTDNNRFINDLRLVFKAATMQADDKEMKILKNILDDIERLESGPRFTGRDK